jgi:hypothetical protein
MAILCHRDTGTGSFGKNLDRVHGGPGAAASGQSRLVSQSKSCASTIGLSRCNATWPQRRQLI